MTGLKELISNSALITALISWFIAQVMKMIIVLIKDRKVNFERLVGSGGMPSSHSALVVSLAMSLGLTEGFDSNIFALGTVFALVVMYDAAGVRRAAGQQAAILNKIVDSFVKSDFSRTEKRHKELLGHTPTQVFAGAILGIAVALWRHM